MAAVLRADVLPSLAKPQLRRKLWSAHYPPKSLLPLLPSVQMLFIPFCELGPRFQGDNRSIRQFASPCRV